MKTVYRAKLINYDCNCVAKFARINKDEAKEDLKGLLDKNCEYNCDKEIEEIEIK